MTYLHLVIIVFRLRKSTSPSTKRNPPDPTHRGIRHLLRGRHRKGVNRIYKCSDVNKPPVNIRIYSKSLTLGSNSRTLSKSHPWNHSSNDDTSLAIHFPEIRSFRPITGSVVGQRGTGVTVVRVTDL